MKIKHAKLSQPFGRNQRLVTLYASLKGLVNLASFCIVHNQR